MPSPPPSLIVPARLSRRQIKHYPLRLRAWHCHSSRGLGLRISGVCQGSLRFCKKKKSISGTMHHVIFVSHVLTGCSDWGSCFLPFQTPATGEEYQLLTTGSTAPPPPSPRLLAVTGQPPCVTYSDSVHKLVRCFPQNCSGFRRAQLWLGLRRDPS